MSLIEKKRTDSLPIKINISGFIQFIFLGYYSYINLSSAYQRLFYLPSEECHNQGLAVIREVTDLLKNKTIDLEERHWRIDDIYIRKCYTSSTLGTMPTTAFTTLPEIMNITAVPTTTKSTSTSTTSTSTTPTSTTTQRILTDSTDTTQTPPTTLSSEATLKLPRANETETYTWIIIYYLASLCIFLTVTVFSCFLCQLFTAKKYFTFKNSKVQDVSMKMKEETILTQVNI